MNIPASISKMTGLSVPENGPTKATLLDLSRRFVSACISFVFVFMLLLVIQGSSYNLSFVCKQNMYSLDMTIDRQHFIVVVYCLVS